MNTLVKQCLAFSLSFFLIFSSTSALAASPAGWSASPADALIDGATATITAFKGSGANAMKAVISHRPAAVAVGNQLIKGAGSVALAFAMVELLGAGVDWVLDPANNRIKYTAVAGADDPIGGTGVKGWTWNTAANNPYYSSPEAACRAMSLSYGFIYNSYVSYAPDYAQCRGSPSGSNDGMDFIALLNNPAYNPDAGAGGSSDERYIPISAAAAKVIANAEAGHAESQDFVKAVAVGQANAGELDTALEAVAEPTTDTPNPDAPPVDPTKPFDPSGILDFLKKILASLGLLSLLATISDSITSLADWFKSEPQKKPDKDNEVDIVELPPMTKEVDINFGGSCPADKVVPIKFAGQSINFTMSYTFICTAMGVLKPVVVMVAMMSYMFIVSGNRENS